MISAHELCIYEKKLIVEMKQAGCNEIDKSMNKMEEFNYTVEQFADLQLLRYKVYGFEELSLKQKGVDLLFVTSCFARS